MLVEGSEINVKCGKCKFYVPGLPLKCVHPKTMNCHKDSNWILFKPEIEIHALENKKCELCGKDNVPIIDLKFTCPVFCILRDTFSNNQPAQGQLLFTALIYYPNRVGPFKSGPVWKFTAYSQFHFTWCEDILNLRPAESRHGNLLVCIDLNRLSSNFIFKKSV